MAVEDATITEAGKVKTFLAIAWCCWASKMACLAKLQRQGDKSWIQKDIDLEIVQYQIEALGRWDYFRDNNCFTFEEVQLMIRKIAKALGMCIDFQAYEVSSID